MSNLSTKKIAQREAESLGIKKQDYTSISDLLKRNPTIKEAILFSLIWTEEKIEKSDERLKTLLHAAGNFGKFIHLGNGDIFYSKVENGVEKKTTDTEFLGTVNLINFGNASNETINKIKRSLESESNEDQIIEIYLNKSFNDNSVIHRFYFGAGRLPKNREHIVITEAGSSRPKANENDELLNNDKINSIDLDQLKYPDDLKEVAQFLLGQPNIGSSNGVFENKYINQKTTRFTDAVIFESEDTTLATCVLGNTNYYNSDYKKGAAVLIANAARKLACSGAYPIAMNCGLAISENENDLNKISDLITGIKLAGAKFNFPVNSVDCNFFEGNEPPLFSIGLAGIAGSKTMTNNFKNKGDLIFILGKNVEDVGSSEYLTTYHNVSQSPAPYFNFKEEIVLHNVMRNLIEKNLINAAHSCSQGGLFIALTEMATPNELGFDIVTDAEIREDVFLFGESSGRAVVSVHEDYEDEFIEFMMQTGVSYTLLGHVTQGKMVVDDEHFGFIQGAKTIYKNALWNSLSNKE